MTTPAPDSPEFSLEPLIFNIRGHRVILDADLAKLYGVHTKRFNEAFKRNMDRFPSDFAFQLIPEEVESLRAHLASSVEGNGSQTVTRSSKTREKEPFGNWSQFATSSSLHRGKVYLPWAFTEHGALMVANILRNEKPCR